jgi:hypothetical protein
MLGRSNRTPWRLAAALTLVVGLFASVASCTYESNDAVVIKPDNTPGPIGAKFFGMHVNHLPRGDAAWPTATPISAIRLWDNGTTWSVLQPTPTTWNWAPLDALVNRSLSHHASILLTLGLTPTWASARPHDPSPYGAGASAEPRNMADWRRYVDAVVKRYRGRIAAYEIWNEAIVPAFYTGTPQTMAELTKQAYGVIKADDPRATVVSAGPYTNNIAARWLDQYLSAGAGRYFDVVGLHIYMQTPELMMTGYEPLRQVLANHGINKPVWDTETGYSYKWKLPKAQWPGYVERSLLLAAAGGLSRVYWYAWDNVYWSGLRLVENDGTTIDPAGRAYIATTHWLTGATVIGCQGASHGTGIWNCQLQRGSVPSTVLWNPAGLRDATVPAGTVRIRRVDGTTVALPRSGHIAIGYEPLEFIRR